MRRIKMKKMNWKLRFKNKATLIALIAAAISLIYNILDMFEIVPKIPQEGIISAAGMIVNILVMMGIVVDPTTKGVTDSERVMCYDCPKGDDDS